MNLAKLNSVAKGPTCVPIAELVQDQQYAIENIRKVQTLQYGEKLVVDLEGYIYSYLPLRICLDLLANDGEGLKQFQDQLEISNVFLRRLKGRGRWHPVEFIIALPDDPANAANPIKAADPVNVTDPANSADSVNVAGPANDAEPTSGADADKK